jgi:predicted N-formylglutamate amidohydrolase
MNGDTEPLLSASDPPPVRITNPAGRSLFLLVGDHAGNLIPERLGGLGLPLEDRKRHIAWDMGVAALGRELAAQLDATFIEQRYSRLVIDCNRAPTSTEAIAKVSDGTFIVANASISPTDRDRRFNEIFLPYHQAIDRTLDARLDEGRGVILVSLHTFTPVLDGASRPWEIGVLYDEETGEFAKRVMEELSRVSERKIGNNEPYRFDKTDYTVPVHACRAGLPYVELEVRQDVLANEHLGAAEILARALERARTS